MVPVESKVAGSNPGVVHFFRLFFSPLVFFFSFPLSPSSSLRHFNAQAFLHIASYVGN